MTGWRGERHFLKGQTGTYGGKTATGVTYTGPSVTYRLTTTQRNLAVAIKNDLDAYNSNVGRPRSDGVGASVGRPRLST